MKTLDEVIKELQYWDTCHEYPECFYDDEVTRDALHYLKEYHEHLKWHAYEEHCFAEEKKKIKQAYEQVYTQAKHDDEVSRRWEERYRQSQIPWNQGYCEMGG